MSTNPVDLTLDLCLADGTSTEYYQTEEDRIQKTLRLLTTPRLLTQPQMVLASERGVSTIPCRWIDVVFARTSAPTPLVFPLVFPAGLLDILEVREDMPDEESGEAEEDYDIDSRPISPLRSRVELHTLGGWAVTLKVVMMSRGSIHDQRQSFAHFLELPVIAFRLAQGGIGLINPNNITHLSVCPAPEALPTTALPMDLRRWTPLRFRRPSSASTAIQS
jgi:hypothetical protein